MEERQPHNCPVCGGSEFVKESGYFYCIECQTQCEDIREQLFDGQTHNDEDAERLIGTPFIIKKPRGVKNSKKKGDDFTSWEMLNFVLRGQVEELLAAGAPESLKDTVLQLWAYYLKKIEVAFVSKEEKTLPKLGLSFQSEDAKMLFGLEKKKLVKARRVSSVNADLNTTITNLTDWSSMQIKKSIKRKAKKAFMDKVTELSILESESNADDQSDILNSSELDDSMSLSSTITTQDSTSSIAGLERTDDAKKRISQVTDGEDVDVLNLDYNQLNPRVPTRYKLIVLLYLGLMYLESKIQISDLIRWIREGHLSYYEAAKHLPDSCYVQGRFNNLFRTVHNFPSYNLFLKSASNMAYFLDMVHWPHPNISELAKKYVKELHLPGKVSVLIERFAVLVPLSYKQRERREIPNYEARTLAILIIILKLLFGLDGKTEQKISNTASQLNKWLNMKKEEQGSKLFVWNDWVKKLICRNAVLSNYHFPTKHVLCSDAYGNPYSFINYCKKWNDLNAGLKDKYNFMCENFLRVSQPALINSLMSVLDKLQDNESSKNETVDFPQDFTPYSTYLQKVIEKSSAVNEQFISKPAMKILKEDFSVCDITYLLTPNTMQRVAEENDHYLKIKKKSAQKKFTKFPFIRKTPTKEEYAFQCYVAVTGCKRTALIRPKRTHSPSPSDGDDKKKNKNNKSKGDGDSSAKVGLPNSHMSIKSKKRKKHSSSNKLKKRKCSRSFKLYVPFSQYWFHREEDLTEEQFETYVISRYPFSFSWLLSECAFVSEMSKYTLYKEILRIETLCMKTFNTKLSS